MITLEMSVCQSRSPGVVFVTVPLAEFCGTSGRPCLWNLIPTSVSQDVRIFCLQCKFPLLGFHFNKKIMESTEFVELLLDDMGQSVVSYAVWLHSSRDLAMGIHFIKDKITEIQCMV